MIYTLPPARVLQCYTTQSPQHTGTVDTSSAHQSSIISSYHHRRAIDNTPVTAHRTTASMSADQYSWSPPGLSAEKRDDYMRQLSPDKVPKLGTEGEQYRIVQLLYQVCTDGHIQSNRPGLAWVRVACSW